LLAAIVALSVSVQSTANAQQDGYRFGVGLNYAGFDDCGGFGHGFQRNFFGIPIAPTPRIDAPPFFALYPPVYYSQDIVARPYGVSPFAAPAGIVPTEMGVVAPIHQVNPYFVDPGAEPNSNEPPSPQDGTQGTTQKVTWIQNPYFDPLSDAGNVIAAK
jgi:hypothetical protein